MKYFNHPIKEKKEPKPPTCQSERYGKEAHKGCDCGCKGRVNMKVFGTFGDMMRYKAR